jgi:hypothetical protein
MPRTNLKGTARKRAADKVASKVANRSKAENDSVSTASSVATLATPNTSTSASNGHKPSTSVSNTSTVVPGLLALSPDSVVGMLPQFNEGAYVISDPLNPPETLPQVTETQFNKAESTYQGTLRALKLTGMAFDVADARFTVIGKRAKAFGSGIKAATAVEKVKGDYLDYQSQVEVTNQKTVALENNQAKTVNDRLIAVHTQASMDEKLKQAETDAEMARQKTSEKQNQLAEFKKQLGEYLPSR